MLSLPENAGNDGLALVTMKLQSVDTDATVPA